MVVVHLIFSFNPGGSENMLVDILRHQCKKCTNHLVIVNNIVNPDLLKTLPGETTVHCLNRRPGSRNPWPLLRLNLLLRGIRADVLHMHNVGAIGLFPIWFKGAWRKYVTVHGLQTSCLNLKRYHKVFAISKAVQSDLEERCGCYSTVIDNGIDFSAITRRKKSWQNNEPLKIVQVGRLIHQKKGQHLLISAAAQVREKTGRKLDLTFIGEGESLTFLQAKARESGLEDVCKFVGLWPRKKLYQELHKFDILAQPSIYEGFGLTVVEGIAAGIPVIASDGGGPEEILGNGKYGWLFKNGDIGSLASVIISLISKMQQKTISEKSNAAYEYAIQHYDIINTAEKYLNEY